METLPCLPVRWAELKPDEFRTRRDACPIAFLPLGLCEPHGHVAALGLDLLKAEYYCDEAARRCGGVVAPAQGYHIHETGFHARWLEEVVGEENALMAALPPDVVARTFLYQLRAFANAGFKAVIGVSGHSGGSQEDLRRIAGAFTARTRVPVIVASDPEWIPNLHSGDHAGRYEISQLLDLRPDLVDLSLLARQHEPGSGGRLAVGVDAHEATAKFGRLINEAIVEAIVGQARALADSVAALAAPVKLSFADTEAVWAAITQDIAGWTSCQPKPGQLPVSQKSRWRDGEHYRPAQLIG